MYSHRKQINVFLEMGLKGWREEQEPKGGITKGHEETFRVNRYVNSLDYCGGFICIYMLKLKIIHDIYCSLSYVNCTLIKLSKILLTVIQKVKIEFTDYSGSFLCEKTKVAWDSD